ncbi:MAG: adenylate/guanylate cyclase domain-containing protein, partial [Leptospira sp.]|nr:adenylate/guanylate cyclase domain-containing protein [Leptospira sp.]
TNSFISMAHGLQERENMKDAFGKFVNKEIAELAATGKLKVGGERKDCAIFFSDIRGFTAISEKLEPEEVVEFLNQYMTEMVLCVKSTHGIVDKFIGDAIMAVWGALKANENNTENAINSALMMRQALLKFNKGRGSAKKPVIKIGCGINSGYVVAGQIGSEEKLEYTVIGDAVNLASRVEALNKPFGTDILISQNAYDKVKGIFKVEKMHAIRVKGKEEVQTIYAVLGREDDPKCPDSLKEVRRIVGINFKPLEKTTGKKDTDFKEEKYELA